MNNEVTHLFHDNEPVNIGMYKIITYGRKYFSFWNGESFVGLWSDLPDADGFRYAHEGSFDHIPIGGISAWTGFTKSEGEQS